MSDLREKLAGRLFDVVQKARHAPIDPATMYVDAQWTEYAALADECIRQMEWAREAALVSVSEPGRDWAENRREHPDRYPSLTSAPDDWRPE